MASQGLSWMLLQAQQLLCTVVLTTEAADAIRAIRRREGVEEKDFPF